MLLKKTLNKEKLKKKGAEVGPHFDQIKTLTQILILESIRIIENKKFWRNVSNQNNILA